MFTLIYAFIQSFQFNMEVPFLPSLTAFCLTFQFSHLSLIYLSLQYSLYFLYLSTYITSVIRPIPHYMTMLTSIPHFMTSL